VICDGLSVDEKTVSTHKDLNVWKKAMDQVAQVYSLTAKLSKKELYGLTSQIRRSAVSIPSNIAEGAARHSRKEFIQFLHIASGSVAELETQLLLAIQIGLLSGDHIISHVEEVRKLLLGLLRSLKKKPFIHHSSHLHYES
jgi:four helix bundle protein